MYRNRYRRRSSLSNCRVVFVQASYNERSGESSFGLLAVNGVAAGAVLVAASVDAMGVAAMQRRARQRAEALPPLPPLPPTGYLPPLDLPQQLHHRNPSIDSAYAGSVSSHSHSGVATGSGGAAAVSGAKKKHATFRQTPPRIRELPGEDEDDDAHDGGAGMRLEEDQRSRSSGRKRSVTDNELDCDVVFLVGPEADVQRIPANSTVLAQRSPVFRAMFNGPMAVQKSQQQPDDQAAAAVEGTAVRKLPAAGGGIFAGNKSTIAVSDVDGRSFDILLKYLYNETVTLQSVMTALTTLYAAHKYMCPGLARTVVNYLRENLSERNVLLVLQHICLYCSSARGEPWAAPVTSPPRRRRSSIQRQQQQLTHEPSAPPLYPEEEDRKPLLLEDAITEDDVREFEAGMAVSDSPKKRSGGVNCCAVLLKECLELIDRRASAVLASEDLEDLDIAALKMVVCRETLCASETDVYDALLRWSARECKRQRLALTPANRRAALEGAQFLVRYLTLTPEELTGASGLLTPEEASALTDSVAGVSFVEMPDHLAELQGLMAAKRKGRSQTSTPSVKLSKKLKKKSSKKDKEDSAARHAAAERDRRKVEELKERNKRKFNLVEEFFVCLACIFD